MKPHEVLVVVAQLLEEEGLGLRSQLAPIGARHDGAHDRRCELAAVLNRLAVRLRTRADFHGAIERQRGAGREEVG